MAPPPSPSAVLSSAASDGIVDPPIDALHSGGETQRPRGAGFDAWWTLTIVCLLYVCSYLDRFIISMVVPNVKHSLHLSDFQIGVILGPAFAVFFGVFGIPLGWAADRYSRRMVILLGTVLFACATAVSGLAGSFGMLLFARICVGVGEASLSPAALSLIAAKFPKHQLTTAISIFSMGPKVGTAIAFAVGGLAVAAAAALSNHVARFHGVEPWRVAFAVTALPSLLIGLLCVTFREPARAPRDGAADKADGAIRFLLSQRALFVPMLVAFSSLIVCGQSLIAWTPAYVDRIFHWLPIAYGPVLSAISMVGAVSLVPKGMIMDWLFARGIKDVHLRFYTWLLVGSMPFVVAAFLVQSLAVFLVSYTVLIVITVPCIAYASVVVQIVTPPYLRGRVFAAFSIPLAMVGGLGPPIVGALTDYLFHDEVKLGWSLTLVFCIFVPVAIVALRICLRPLRTIVEEQGANTAGAARSEP